MPASDDAADRAEGHRRRASFFIDVMAYDDARREVDAVLALRPDDPSLRHFSARLALTMNDFRRAEADIAIALRLAPDDLDIRATSAHIMDARPAPVEALEQFNEIIAKSPTYLYARGQRARLLMRLHRHREALPDLDFLLSGDAPRTEYFEVRAAVYMVLNMPKRAVADYTMALQDRPDASYLLTERATAYERAGDDATALGDLDKLIPGADGRAKYAIGGDQLAKLYIQRAFILERMKRFRNAAADVAAAVRNGGVPTMLRVQIFLRRNGFPQIPLDGRDSQQLHDALEACFGLNACFQGAIKAI
jgi:tetratricopeptide (TPR) repeat protein